MKFSFKWLKDYVDISLSPQELAEKLVLAGFEVEAIEPIGERLAGIKSAKINTISPHPNADRLVITQVFDGNKTHQIVTGATNISEGDIIPLSLPGSTLANGTILKASKLRGVDSKGMLCSQAELGVADEATGIWILPSDTPIGIDLIHYANLKDTLLDIAILPNRGDCQSIYGLAREISALLHKPLKDPTIELSYSDKTSDVKIISEAPKACPYYIGHVIHNLKPKPSPLWMQRRLELLGIRPINTLVDITNYVLLELGQPLHAFDYECLTEKSIVIRYAKAQETLHLLDQTLSDPPKILEPSDLLICHGNTPIALAGVMGGLSTEINPNTTSIFLEAAYFDAKTIRATAVKHELRTESMIRFEKGIDAEAVQTASKRALHLYQACCPEASIQHPTISKHPEHDCFQPKVIRFDSEKISQYLGVSIDHQKSLNYLKALGFEHESRTQTIKIPSWRQQDIEDWPCLAEEIARSMGYDAIPSQMPELMIIQENPPKEQVLSENIQDFLVNQGLYESISFPMISPDDVKDLEKMAYLSIKNPLSNQESVMRPSLIPSLLKIVAFNQRRQQQNLKLFEIGHCYHAKHGEQLTCTGMIIGEWLERVYEPKLSSINTSGFFHIKGLIESLSEALGFEFSYQKARPDSKYHPKLYVDIMINTKKIGHFGYLHPLYCQSYGIESAVGYFNLNLSALSECQPLPKYHKPLSKYPAIRRDIAFLAPKSLTFSELEETINKKKPKLIQEFYLFDSFESETLGKDQKSLALAFLYQDHHKTLADDKINRVHQAFCKTLENTLPITIR